MGHGLGQCAVRTSLQHLARASLGSTHLRCLVRQVAVVPSIALDLSADCDDAHPSRAAMARIDALATLTREISSRWAASMRLLPVSLGGQDFTCLCQDSMDRRVGAIKELADLMQRPALLPALPHQRLLAVRKVDSGSLLHSQHSCRLRGC